MSIARKCDRCGRFYESSSKSRVVYEYYPNSTSHTKNGGDMCPKCAEKFAKWWNKKREEVRQ